MYDLISPYHDSFSRQRKFGLYCVARIRYYDTTEIWPHNLWSWSLMRMQILTGRGLSRSFQSMEPNDIVVKSLHVFFKNQSTERLESALVHMADFFSLEILKIMCLLKVGWSNVCLPTNVYLKMKLTINHNTKFYFYLTVVGKTGVK